MITYKFMLTNKNKSFFFTIIIIYAFIEEENV